MSEVEYGRYKCPSPICGKKGNLKMSKNGLMCFICPHCDDETLVQCSTKIFFGLAATNHMLGKVPEKDAPKIEKIEGDHERFRI